MYFSFQNIANLNKTCNAKIVHALTGCPTNRFLLCFLIFFCWLYILFQIIKVGGLLPDGHKYFENGLKNG